MRTLFWMSLVIGLAASAVPVRADDQADLKKLVDKAITAMGGDAKVARLKTVTWKGKGALVLDNAENAFTEESTTHMPERLRFEMGLDLNGNKETQILVIDGDKGWIKAGNQTVDMPKQIRTALRDYFYAHSLVLTPMNLLDKAVKLGPLGEVQVNERPAVGIQATRKDHRDVNIYFDKETGLPVKCEMIAGQIDGEQDVNFEFYFNEYKEFEGAKTPTKMLWKRDGKKYVEREIAEVQYQEKLDDSVFAKP